MKIKGTVIRTSSGWPRLFCASGASINEIELIKFKKKIEEFDCYRCGIYYVDYNCSLNYKWSAKDLSLMLNYHLLNRDSGQKSVYSLEVNRIIDGVRWINPKSLLENWPKDTIQRVEKTLVNIYLYFDWKTYSELWTNQYLFELLSFASRKKSCDEELESIDRILKLLEIEHYVTRDTDLEGFPKYMLTLNGMKRAKSILNGMEYPS